MLPGEDLINKGLEDLLQGEESVEALLVAIGSPRLRRLGHQLPATLPSSPERRLYLKLSASEANGAHSKYNALIRTLVSFERASECVNR
jgi:hypothetical protein